MIPASSLESDRIAAGTLAPGWIARRIRDLMARHKIWTGTAAELLRLGLEGTGNGDWGSASGWPKNPRALAGRLRRAQPGLRALGIEIVFSREGRARTRTITMRWSVEHTVGTVSSSAA
jgi:hypothetical protein